MPLFTYKDLDSCKDIEPEELYTNKEKQKDFTRLLNNGEVIAVIVPFESNNSKVVDNNTDNGTVNISEIIRENNDDSDEDDIKNKEFGNFRSTLSKSKERMVDMPEQQDVYSTASFDIENIDKIS